MVKKGFKIQDSAELFEQLIDYRNTYNNRGKYLGFDNLDELYTMQLGTCTDWTGFPMSGKTQILMEMLLNTSIFYGWKHLIYFPDVGNSVEIVADLLHKKTSKTFNPDYKNKITDKEIYRNTEWVLDHFKILTKSDVKAKLTPFEFWDIAAGMKDQIQTASIDSWKDMSHPYNEYGGYAMYLESVLPYRNQIAEDNNLHLHTVIHPKLTEKENGVRKAPTPYDLKGGSEWFNSGKCMITVHREGTETNIADIHVNKVKPRSAGNVGKTSLQFDITKFVYYTAKQQTGSAAHFKQYAKPKEEVKKPQPKEEPIKPNTDFDIKETVKADWFNEKEQNF